MQFARSLRSLAAFLVVCGVCQMASAHTVNLAYRCEPNGSVTFFAASYHRPTSPVGGLIVDGTVYPFTSVTDPLPNNVDDSRGFLGTYTEGSVTWQVVNVSGLAPGGHNITTTSTTATEAPLVNWTPVIDCCEIITMDFTSSAGTPFSYTEDGIIVESQYSGGGGHIHLSGSSISNHDGCCSQPYRFRKTDGAPFTLSSLNVLSTSGSGYFQSSTGAVATISGTGTINFPAAGWTNISHFYWRQVSGGSAIDNVVISTCPPQNARPSVTCPAPQIVECQNAGTSATTLIASVTDPDGDALTVTWSVNGTSVQTNNVASGTTVSLTDTFALGSNSVSINVSDGSLAHSCSTSVTVIDTIAPVIICAGDVVLANDPGQCSAVNPGLPSPTVTDTCTNATYTNDAPAVFPLETTVVTWTATDSAGNTATCTQLVTVIDTEPPTIVCPADVVVSHDAGLCVATGVVLGDPVFSDNCAATVSNNAPDEFPLGITVVTWTAEDAAGNTATCDQYVEVTNAAPIAVAGTDTILECESTSGTVFTLDGTASSDPDAGDILSFDWNAVGITFDDPTSTTPTATFPHGSTAVTLTVTDQCGAVSSSDVIIVVQDTVAPQIHAIYATPNVLWPPNHDMIPVSVDMLLSDTCENTADLLVSCKVSSDEPDDATGDGAFSGDVDGSDGYTTPVSVTLSYDASTGKWVGGLNLRAERDGAQDGRKYSIVVYAADDSGNISQATACVVVPKSQKGGKTSN